ncbi:four helix bundle protein [Candidatus Desantisbacteria bacterium]|nr:four helix bundle protein [Candidatus Desantisbacteria bacterium]
MPRYEELGVWQLANRLVMEVCRIVNRYPREAAYNDLAIQMKGASMGVAMNIAEGHSQQTLHEYRHFLEAAMNSLRDITFFLKVSYQNQLINEAAYNLLLKEYERVRCLVMSIVKWIESETISSAVAA